METKNRQNMYLPIILFVLIGAMFVGTPEIKEPQSLIYINSECQDYDTDYDSDGFSGMIDEIECHEYPYSDGNGESSTQPSSQGVNSPYQTYFDLSVDFTRYFLEKECNNNLQNCISTNFITEVEFYCYFSNNIMFSSWDSIFNTVFNSVGILPDDGSITTYQDTCLQFGGPIGIMPDNGGQQSSPIPDNPTGQSNGGIGAGK